MSVRHALLALLSEGPKYGLQLRQEFEARTGEVWPLNVGQVYTTLQRLERDGLVESDDAAEEGPQKGFHITAEGADELDQWLRTPPDFSSPPRDELVIKVLVALGLPGRGRARGRPGAPPLPRRADAAVDAPQGGRVPPRSQLRPGGRRRAVPARLADPVAGHGRRPSEESGGGRGCAGSHVVPPPQGPAQGGSPPNELSRTARHLQGLRRGGHRGARPAAASTSPSTPGRSWPSWAPAARARARC